MDSMTVGVIGCGKQAPKHVKGLQAAGANVILADLDPKRAEAMANDLAVEWTPSPADVFGSDDIIAIDICTPTRTHASLIEQSIDAGKHWFCEKPLTDDPEAAERIARRTEEAGLSGRVGYVYRFVPAFRMARRILGREPGSQSALGDITTAMFRLGGRGSHQLWKHRTATGGGAINEMLVHMLDLAIWWFGPVEEVDLLTAELLRPTRRIDGRLEHVDAEDYVLVRARMAEGVNVFLQADLVSPGFSQFVEVHGTNGSFLGSIQSERPSYVYCEEPQAAFPAGRTELQFPREDLFEAQMRDFLHLIAGHAPSQGATPRESMLVRDAMDRIRLQMQTPTLDLSQ